MIVIASNLLINVDKIQTTELGVKRIQKNLEISEDVVAYCKVKVVDKNSLITRKGKNWYVENDNCIITINSHSYTIITAHKK